MSFSFFNSMSSSFGYRQLPPGPTTGGGGHYKVLGVERAATAKTIRQAFRTKAKDMHPDRGGDPEAFKKLANAYDVLSTPSKRRTYDVRSAAVSPRSKLRRRRRTKPPPPVVVRVPISLAQLYQGGSRDVQYVCTVVLGPDGKSADVCSQNTTRACEACAGRGVVSHQAPIALSFLPKRRSVCHECEGSGRKLESGYRRVCEKRVETIHLKPGQTDGTKIVRRGVGHARLDGVTGDVVFVLYQEADGLYASKGTELIFRPSLSLADALCGIRLRIRHPRGTPIVLVSPNCVLRPNAAYVIQGLGMPSGSGTFGRLLVIPKIRFPAALSVAQKRAVRPAIGEHASPPSPPRTIPLNEKPDDGGDGDGSDDGSGDGSGDGSDDDDDVYHLEHTVRYASGGGEGENNVQCPQQ